MVTHYHHRLLAIIPDARKAALASWISANLQAGQGFNWLSVGLSPTGQPPATAWWFSAALTAPEIKAVAQRLMDLANAAGATLSLPGNWDTRTPAQRRTILRAGRDEVYQYTGIWIAPDVNTDAWDAPDAELTRLGLQRIGVAL